MHALGVLESSSERICLRASKFTTSLSRRPAIRAGSIAWISHSFLITQALIGCTSAFMHSHSSAPHQKMKVVPACSFGLRNSVCGTVFAWEKHTSLCRIRSFSTTKISAAQKGQGTTDGERRKFGAKTTETTWASFTSYTKSLLSFLVQPKTWKQKPTKYRFSTFRG